MDFITFGIPLKTTRMKLKLALTIFCLLGIGLFAHSQDAPKKQSSQKGTGTDTHAQPKKYEPVDDTLPPPPPPPPPTAMRKNESLRIKALPPPPPPPLVPTGKNGKTLPAPKAAMIKEPSSPPPPPPPTRSNAVPVTPETPPMEPERAGH